MRKEYLEKVENCTLEYVVNLELSNIDDHEGSLTADDFDNVYYQIRDGKLLSWDGRFVMNLEELNDSWWDGAGKYVEDQDDPVPMSWYECFISEVMNYVIQNDLIGAPDFECLISDERIMIVILRHEERDVIEEMDDWNIIEAVD